MPNTIEQPLRRSARIAALNARNQITNTNNNNVAGRSTSTRGRRRRNAVANQNPSSSAGPTNSGQSTQRGRRRIIAPIEEIDDDSDSDIDMTAGSTIHKPNNNTNIEVDAVNNNVDIEHANENLPVDAANDDNPEEEQCSICLDVFNDQEIGVPNVCEHKFCATCIESWSGHVDTCPIDRKQFTSIRIQPSFANGVFIREVPIQRPVIVERSFDNANDFMEFSNFCIAFNLIELLMVMHQIYFPFFSNTSIGLKWDSIWT